MSREIIKVDGMTCGHCVETVTGAVQKLGGVQSVNVNLDKKEVAVQFDDAITPLSSISSSIEEVGFEVIKD